MSQLEESVALLVTSVAVPLASFIAVAVGCGDSTAKKRSQKKSLSSKRLAKRQSSKSSKRSRSSKSHGKSKRHHKSAAQSAAALKTAKQATSDQISAKPVADSVKLSDSKRVPSKSKPSSRSSSKSKRSASKRRSSSKKHSSSSKRSGVRHERARKRSSASSKDRSSKSKRRSSKSKLAHAAAKNIGAVPADKSASSRSKSVKKTSLSQNMAEKNYIPVGASKTDELSVYPDSLNFGIKGGQLILTVANASPSKRFALKIKCSDNQLYRLNPVYAFVEPKQTVPLTVYRHCGVAKVDKLVIVTIEASKEETEPKSAFKDPNVIHPMMLVPLYVHGGNVADLDGLQRAPCTCAV